MNLNQLRFSWIGRCKIIHPLYLSCCFIWYIHTFHKIDMVKVNDFLHDGTQEPSTLNIKTVDDLVTPRTRESAIIRDKADISVQGEISFSSKHSLQVEIVLRADTNDDWLHNLDILQRDQSSLWWNSVCLRFTVLFVIKLQHVKLLKCKGSNKYQYCLISNKLKNVWQ